MSPENQYYSLNLGTIEIKHTRQSFYRHWNRLHRFQKTIVALAFILFFLYVLTHIEFHRTSLKNIPSNHEHLPILAKNNDKPIQLDINQRFYRKDPRIQSGKGKLKMTGPTNERQVKVVEAFKHAWKAYKEIAWGYDELKPVSRTSSSWFNLGLTIVDSLDTMYIMNLQEQFDEARQWVKTGLNLEVDKFNNLFEITIRIIGGLLSAFHLSGDRMFLDKAFDVGNRSLPAFDTKSSIPLSDINLMRRTAKSPYWTTDSSLAEVATLQIEFKDLSYSTGDKRFKEAVSKVSEVLHRQNKQNGLAPIYVDTQTGHFVGHTITLGARGDSYYEYLLKQWIQNGAKYDPNDKENYLIEDWLDSVKGIKEKLIRKTKPGNFTFVGELLSETFSPKMDHLVCFLPGNLALGSVFLDKNPNFPKDEVKDLLTLAEEILETCNQMYVQMETGLSPEIAHFNTHEGSVKDLYVKEADRHNLLRPETIESLYYLYKITRNKKYQEYGWKIFESFEKYTKVESGGYSSINDVTNKKNVNMRDKMESFFLAETLKYFYLLFEDDDRENFDLNKWLINTEAHLIPIPEYS